MAAPLHTIPVSDMNAMMASSTPEPLAAQAPPKKARKSRKKKQSNDGDEKTNELPPRPKGPPPAGTLRWLKHVAEFKENNPFLCSGKSGAQIVKLARETYVPKAKCEACNK